jgi:DNA-binding NarL/FixJ family response regulator
LQCGGATIAEVRSPLNAANFLLRAGTDGHVLKNASYEELVLALRHVALGKRFLSADVSGHLVDALVSTTQATAPAAAPSPWNKLTARERSILKLIAEGRTNRGAAEYLKGSPKTIEKHRASVMRKLGLRNVAELTLVALESGLIERPGSVLRQFNDPEPRNGASVASVDP